MGILSERKILLQLFPKNFQRETCEGPTMEKRASSTKAKTETEGKLEFQFGFTDSFRKLEESFPEYRLFSLVSFSPL